MNNQNMIDTVTRISGVNPRKCMRCGKCSASCPAYDEMEYHPHQFVSMVENGRIEELLSSKGIYTCLSCFACVERCPRNVEPAKLIEAVRNAVERQQGMDHLKPERIPEILDEELPQQAIAVRDGFSYVFRLNPDQRVSQIKVQAGRRLSDRIEIVGGITADTTIVVSGAGFLNDGDLVRNVKTPVQTPVAAPAAKK